MLIDMGDVVYDGYIDSLYPINARDIPHWVMATSAVNMSEESCPNAALWSGP